MTLPVIVNRARILAVSTLVLLAATLHPYDRANVILLIYAGLLCFPPPLK